jgi:stage II sporulation protein P
MRKNRSGYVALVVIAIFLFMTIAASRSSGFFNPDTVNVSINSAQESADQDIQIESVSDSDDIRINLSEEENPADSAAPNEQTGNVNAVNTDVNYTGTTEENPVLNFFNTLATNISTKMSAQSNNEVSIVIEENEHVDEDVSHEITIDVEDYPIVNTGNAAVLIYHTHTREAYTPEFEGQYVACGDFRTDDQQYSVCAVGEKLANLLSSQYGFSVMHDTTMNETTPFTQSYDKSLTTMESDIAQNPNLGIFIDVHRNSIDDREFAKNDIVSSNGKEYAKVMFVVGRGDGLTGAEAPDWQSNYALAKAITDEINKIMPGMAKEPMVKAKRYNQHLSNKSMLIEMGYDANTITQAENSADIVAQAMAAVLSQ